jgi:ATP-dependent DNA helicase Rep
MTTARKRRQYGEAVTCEPSRFIAELPEEDLHWQGGGQDTKEDNEARGQETLAGLKGLFA